MVQNEHTCHFLHIIFIIMMSIINIIIYTVMLCCSPCIYVNQ